MRLFFGVVLWVCFCMYIGVMFNGCASDGLREGWQDCAGVSHEICRMMPDSELELDCEYEYYKVCIGE